MRKPNGYGSVVKLNGNRRKPYAARITTGFEPYLDKHGQVKSRQKYHTIGTYPNQREAELALAVYNNDPYDPFFSSLTFEECYSEAMKYKGQLSDSTLNSYRTGYKKCSVLYKKKLSSIKTRDLQFIVDKQDTPSKQNQIIKVFNTVFDFAVDNLGFLHTNPTKPIHVTAKEREREEPMPYSKIEMEKLWQCWDNANQFYVSATLCQIYLGTRIMELLKLKKDDVHINERWARIEGTKNDNADRIVPLRKEIIPLLEYHMNDPQNKTDYVFVYPKTGEPFPKQQNYMKFSYNKLRKNIFDTQHSPHDARHTFITRADESNININTLKKIVGHSLEGITGKTYTHKSIETMVQEVDKIKFF